jgi:uncharacterized membrane protein YtjA (UPF0391 family)
MLYGALFFLIVALLADLLGFVGVAFAAAGIAAIVFFSIPGGVRGGIGQAYLGGTYRGCLNMCFRRYANG